MATLNGKKVAILVADGFEQVELTGPLEALLQAGAGVDIVSPKVSQVRAVQHDQPGDEFDVDVNLADANADDYDALVLPGGVMNPDTLRINPDAIAFIKDMAEAGKPIAAICHGPWTLIEAGLVKGRMMTSWPSLRTDLRNAGADWVDQEVVTDRGLVTSRRPSDIPAFNAKMIEEFAEGKHGSMLSGDHYQQQPGMGA